MSDYTAETPARCPKCGCALTERTGRSMGEVVYMYDCDHCGWDDEYARADRLTVATAPWSRDLWAEVERLTADRDAAAAHARHLQEALDNTFKDRDADIAEVDRLRSAAAERAEADRDAAAAKERAAVVAWLREVSWWSTTDAHAASIERGEHLEVTRA